MRNADVQAIIDRLNKEFDDNVRDAVCHCTDARSLAADYVCPMGHTY